MDTLYFVIPLFMIVGIFYFSIPPDEPEKKKATYKDFSKNLNDKL